MRAISAEIRQPPFFGSGDCPVGPDLEIRFRRPRSSGRARPEGSVAIGAATRMATAVSGRAKARSSGRVFWLDRRVGLSGQSPLPKKGGPTLGLMGLKPRAESSSPFRGWIRSSQTSHHSSSCNMIVEFDDEQEHENLQKKEDHS
jgi:hypothetical protein